MKICLKKYYDPDSDPNCEASKLDNFLKSIYDKGQWRKSKKGIEITL